MASQSDPIGPQHAIPGIVLLVAGLQTITDEPHGTALALALEVESIGNWIWRTSTAPNTFGPRWRRPASV